MLSRIVAKKYAKALLEIGLEDGNYEALGQDLDKMADPIQCDWGTTIDDEKQSHVNSSPAGLNYSKRHIIVPDPGWHTGFHSGFPGARWMNASIYSHKHEYNSL